MPAQRSSPPWIGCVRIPRFPVQVELARRPELRGFPVAITARAFASGATAATPVTHCSPEAEEQGVRPGMPVREVIATCRETVLLSPDPEWYRERPRRFSRRFGRGGPRRRRRRVGHGLHRSHGDGAPVSKDWEPLGGRG